MRILVQDVLVVVVIFVLIIVGMGIMELVVNNVRLLVGIVGIVVIVGFVRDFFYGLFVCYLGFWLLFLNKLLSFLLLLLLIILWLHLR